MKIVFYGLLGDRLGREAELSVPPGTQTIADLRAVLAENYPEAGKELRNGSRACVADCFVGEDFPLDRADSVEFLSPLSGG